MEQGELEESPYYHGSPEIDLHLDDSRPSESDDQEPDDSPADSNPVDRYVYTRYNIYFVSTSEQIRTGTFHTTTDHQKLQGWAVGTLHRTYRSLLKIWTTGLSSM